MCNLIELKTIRNIPIRNTREILRNHYWGFKIQEIVTGKVKKLRNTAFENHQKTVTI